jgi:hypothetical protein
MKARCKLLGVVGAALTMTGAAAEYREVERQGGIEVQGFGAHSVITGIDRTWCALGARQVLFVGIDEISFSKSGKH